MTTTVVNIRNTYQHYFYVGRPTKWGNPFRVYADGSNRADVIAQYQQWLLGRPDLVAALPELRDKVLGCYCKPEACHGDILAALADNPELLVVLRAS